MTDAVSDLTETKRSWGESLKAFTHPRAVAMLFLGVTDGHNRRDFAHGPD